MEERQHAKLNILIPVEVLEVEVPYLRHVRDDVVMSQQDTFG